MKQRVITVFLFCAMGLLLVFSAQAAQASRLALQLCAYSVIPSLFPFFVLSSLFVTLSPSILFPRAVSRVANRVLGCGDEGVSVFFLGILGGYPLGARTIAQMYKKGRLRSESAQHLLLFCNNAGPAFILGMVGLGRFNSLRIGAYLYLIHVFCAALLGILLPKKQPVTATPHLSVSTPSFASALVDSIAGAGSSMVQICSFVVFFVTLLQLLIHLTGISHPLLLGFVELTNGVMQLETTRFDFSLAAALLGWGGISVHLQTAAALQDTPVHFRRYLLAKAAHAILSFCIAFTISSRF